MLFPGGGLESQRANDDIRFRAGKMVFVAIIKPVDVVPSSFGDPIFCEDPETMPGTGANPAPSASRQLVGIPSFEGRLLELGIGFMRQRISWWKTKKKP